MSQSKGAVKSAIAMNPLLKNQLIGGICASLVVIFACIRIFVLKASPDGIFANLISMSGAILSLVVLTSAVRIMLSTKKARGFEETFASELDKIDKRYGALIEASDAYKGDDEDGAVYSIANNVDAIFLTDSEQWGELQYKDKFIFSGNFTQTKTIYYYFNHSNMKARADRLGDDLATTARLLARDTAVIIQRSFSDILTAHALEIKQEEGRAVVTIKVNSAKTDKDAERLAELIDYLLFLHFVTT